MTFQINKTLRSVLVATVASSLTLSACSGGSDDRQQPKMTGELHAPAANPQLNAEGKTAHQMAAMRTPEGNGTGAVGSQYHAATPHQDDMMATAPTQMAPAQKEKAGMFSWLKRDEPQQVNTMQRRVPALNRDPDVQMQASATASYEAAAPVPEVSMASTMPVAEDDWMAPQNDIIVAEEVVVMDESFTPMEMGDAKMDETGTYPSLASVPARPQRVDAIESRDVSMAEMEAARAESMEQSASMNAQIVSDMEGNDMGMQGDAQSDIDAEFAALVASEDSVAMGEGYGEVMSADSYAARMNGDGAEVVIIEEQTPAVIVSQEVMQPWEAPGEMNQAPAPIQMANTQRRPVQSWEPAPMVEPQTASVEPQMMQPQTEVVVQEDQWVSLQQDPAAQMAVPVEGVTVVGAPQVASVSAVPVMPADSGASVNGGIQLTPPSTYGRATRTLPESRYAARRQAVYMQRYARQVQADEGY